MKRAKLFSIACTIAMLSAVSARAADEATYAAPLDISVHAVTPSPTAKPLYLQTSEPAEEGGDAAALAKKLSNPVSSLISVPLQNNFDFGAGPNNNKFRYTLNVQPVIPVTLNDDWNLIVRVIVPTVYADSLIEGKDSEFGIGDINPTFFFTPRQTFGGWILGAGPVFLLPTATDDSLGTGKWSIGPSVIALQQNGPWTYGVLANHLWSFAGQSDRGEVNQTFIQPFAAYNFPTGFGLTMQAESTYNWDQSQWTVPVGFFASQVLKVGGQAISVSAGPRVYVEGPSGGPEWGFRFTLTFLFPK